MATRKPNRKSKRAGRRRRRNTSASASVSAPKSTARFTNRGTSRKSNGRRRRRNTGTVRRVHNAVAGASLAAMSIAGAGIIAFDLLTNKFLGPQSAGLNAAIKMGGGYLLMSNGRKVPFVGKYSELIGFGLVLIGIVDGLRVYALPRVAPYLPSVFLPAPVVVQPAATGVQGLVNFNPRSIGLGGLVNMSPAYASGPPRY